MSSAGVSQKNRNAVTRKESVETQDYGTCPDMEVDNDKSLEETGFVPKAVSDPAGCRELLRVKHMCDKTCNEEGFNFCDLASIVVE